MKQDKHLLTFVERNGKVFVIQKTGTVGNHNAYYGPFEDITSAFDWCIQENITYNNFYED